MPTDKLERYDLLTPVTDGPVRTYHALARTGAIVMVHFVDRADAAEHAHARNLLERLPADERRRILEVQETEDSLAVVTKFIMDFDSFTGWLASRANPAPSDPTPPPAEPEALDATSSRLGPMRLDTLEPPPVNVLADETAEPAIPGGASPDPGEVLGSLPAAPPAMTDDSLDSVLPPPAPRAEETSSTLPDWLHPTRVDGTSDVPAILDPADPEHQRTSTSDTGEFLAAFGKPLEGGKLREDVQDSSPPRAPSEPGEFTRAFQAFRIDSPAAPAEPIGPPSAPTSSQNRPADSLGSKSANPPVGGVQPIASPTSPDAGRASPGDFTALFRAVQPPSQAAATPRPEERSGQPSQFDPPASGTLDSGGRQEPPPTPFRPDEVRSPAHRSQPTGLPEPALGSAQRPEADRPPALPELRWSGEPARAPAPPTEPGSPGSQGGGPSSSPPAHPEGLGEFTKIFGRADLPPKSGGDVFGYSAPSTQSPGRQGGPDYLDRLTTPHGSPPPVSPSSLPVPQPMQPEATGISAVPPWLGQQAADHRPIPTAGPSEFTRVISAQTPPPPAPPVVSPPAAAPQTAAPTPSSTPKALLAGLVAVVVITLAVILVFALRGPTEPTAQPDESSPAAAAADSI